MNRKRRSTLATALRCSTTRGAGPGSAGECRRRGAPRAFAICRGRAPGRGARTALHRRCRVLPHRRRRSRALRGPGGARRCPGRRTRVRRSHAGDHVVIRNLRRADLVAAGLALLLAWLVIYPILIVAGDAADATAVRAFLTRPGEWAALWASIWISLVSVVLAAAIGIPLAFLFEWFDFPGRKTLGALIALPVVLPPLVGVIAFLFLYGESGFNARAIQAALHLEQAPWR